MIWRISNFCGQFMWWSSACFYNNTFEESQICIWKSSCWYQAAEKCKTMCTLPLFNVISFSLTEFFSTILLHHRLHLSFCVMFNNHKEPDSSQQPMRHHKIQCNCYSCSKYSDIHLKGHSLSYSYKLPMKWSWLWTDVCLVYVLNLVNSLHKKTKLKWCLNCKFCIFYCVTVTLIPWPWYSNLTFLCGQDVPPCKNELFMWTVQNLERIFNTNYPQPCLTTH